MISQHFTPGAKVALISGRLGEHIVARTVGKVYKNGNFTLASQGSYVDPQQWRPEPNGKTARKAGARQFGRGFIRLWDDSMDQEFEAKKAQSEIDRDIGLLTERLAGRRTGYGNYILTPEQAKALRDLLGLLPPPNL